MPFHSVVPVGDGEDTITFSVPGFVVDAKGMKKKTAPQKVDLQFGEPQDAVHGPPSRTEAAWRRRRRRRGGAWRAREHAGGWCAKFKIANSAVLIQALPQVGAWQGVKLAGGGGAGGVQTRLTGVAGGCVWAGRGGRGQV